MEGIEDHKNELDGSGSLRVCKPSDSKCTKEPRQTKQKCYSCDIDEQTDTAFPAYMFVAMLVFFPAMFDQHHDYHSKYNNVEEQDDKDWAQEGSKEDCRIGDEAAGRRDRTHDP